MAIKGLTLKQSMGRNIQAIMPQEDEKNSFKARLVNFLEVLRDKPKESEEFQKEEVKKLFSGSLSDNYLNTSGRIDLAIYNSYSHTSNIGVIVETKSIVNNSEMMTTQNINTKAFQEIVHYYLNERIVEKNIEIKKCIITNGYSWFVIEAKEFERHFYNNKQLRERYNKWKSGQLSDMTTTFLFKEVIAPAIDKAIINGITIAHFDLRDALISNNPISIKESNLTQLYRFFTPENLLNKEIFTDSNKLNKGFYDELLYIMGLEEVKIGREKLIQRLPIEKRQYGSFVENAIDRLDAKDFSKEQQYDSAVQLTVIWINRILFLKLLESQLVSFNNDKAYKFLTYDKIATFDDMYDLFFGVLARKTEDRSGRLSQKFSYIPYLNSSLFEEAELEKLSNGIGIQNLRDEKIKVFKNTALRGVDNKRKQNELPIIKYLFEFLESYDFSTAVVHKGDTTNDLINASVLGLIFEKINGYKDGSYYTPGRITMYMSRKAVRKAVINRINEEKNWNCKVIDDVKVKLESIKDRKEISGIISSVRICDPAVGSGHFLVSVLNELIAIKSDLKCLFYTDDTIMTDVTCNVINDELIIQDMNGNNFAYKAGNDYLENIQKAIFEEKKILIENCLFGVDINPNSVNICRLRLWIELLKNSYYEMNSSTKKRELITLPNIDINIKIGNSLLRKYNLHDSFDMRQKKFKEYVTLVKNYKNTNDKKTKAELSLKINEMKQSFSDSINTPERKRLTNLVSQKSKIGQINLFATQIEKKEQVKKIKEFDLKIKEAKNKVAADEKNPFFKYGMEWRMEFPEILDDNGNFIGFDLVIANPPYIYSSENFFSESEKSYFIKTYPLNKYQANTFGLFMELSLQLLRKNGYFSVIIPNTFLSVEQYSDMRKHLLVHCGNVLLLNSDDKIFDDASVDNCIVNAEKSGPSFVELAELKGSEVRRLAILKPEELINTSIINFENFKHNSELKVVREIIVDMNKNCEPLEPNYAIVRDGLKVYQKGKGKPKQTTNDEEFKKLKANREWFSSVKKDENYWEIIKGENVSRYGLKKGKIYLRYGEYLAEQRNPEMFKGERLLIRQIPVKSTYTIAVTLTEKPIMHERSVISILKLKTCGKFLLGCLNSKIMSYYALNEYGFLQRKTFPQWRLKQIKSLPIPNANQEQIQYLSNLVEQQLNLHEKTESSNQDIIQIETLNQKIDEFVMVFLGISEEQKAVIRNFSISI